MDEGRHFAAYETTGYSHHFRLASAVLLGPHMKPTNGAALAVCLVALAAGNPGKDDYTSWLVENVPANNASDRLVVYMASPLIKAITTSYNCFFFTLYETPIDQNHHIIGVGALRQFYARDININLITLSNPHVVEIGNTNQFKPQDGYVWLHNPPNGDFSVRWLPGFSSNFHSHVIAGETEGKWLPEDGYRWATNFPLPGAWEVVWEPGQPSRSHPHVIASSQEGGWLPAPGYQWLLHPPPIGDFRVVGDNGFSRPTGE